MARNNDSLAAEMYPGRLPGFKGADPRKRVALFFIMEGESGMAGGMKAKVQDLYGNDKSSFTLKALFHSRTVVEKDGYVSTGVLSYIEGDMMEIELTEFKQFELGDPVHLTIYSPVGIHRMRSTVIAKANGALAVLFPRRALAGLEERRESPRIEIGIKGKLTVKASRTLTVRGQEETIEASEDFKLTTRDISDTGIGFMLDMGPRLNIGTEVDAVLELEEPFACALEIIRHGEMGSYGARFVEMADTGRRAIRAFLLREQVALYFNRKQTQAR